jgi:hypothetical protein
LHEPRCTFGPFGLQEIARDGVSEIGVPARVDRWRYVAEVGGERRERNSWDGWMGLSNICVCLLVGTCVLLAGYEGGLAG